VGALLEVQDLSVHFGGLAAVKNVTFTIEEGERLVMIGPNGAGKTTLFNLLTGQLKPSGGKVLFKGQDITHKPVYARTQLGMARSFQITSLFPNETVLTNARIGLQGTRAGRYRVWGTFVRDKALRQEAQGLLEAIDLWTKRDETVASLAYGEQRKLEMGLSLASSPDLLMLDEPTVGMTAPDVRALAQVIRSLPNMDVTLLIVEHDMEFVRLVADRIIVMHRGRHYAAGSVSEIEQHAGVREIYLGAM